MRALLILRPEPGALATSLRAEALGMVADRHPLFRTEPVAWTLPPGRFDGLLLTSANAVRHAGALPALPIHAVGQATAEAAVAASGTVATIGDGGVKELLAALTADLRLLHLAGEERIVPASPAQEIVAVPVYRTVALDDPPASLVDGRVLLVHSPAAGRRVAALACDPATVRIAAISEAAAAACGARGWNRAEAAERPDDGALLSLAASLCKD
ncbi:hypothetical protein GCM10022280_03270 [Sphingomonas swuensis]|uniref:Tetrapyrrole biosynthesis uroporphyrinogen III synthase domain-containing protein n=1 Tax=Sphingomonas swuensis TaxID=977800 RepID=A0ABP7SCD3_9SPHN